jgi:hypothetical protein
MAVTAVILVQLQALQPVPVTISGTVTAEGQCWYGCNPGWRPIQDETLPVGPTMTVTWSAVGGATVGFWVFGPQGRVCFWEASQGSCTFASMGGEYHFEIISPIPPVLAYYTVNFTVQYSMVSP